MIRSMTGFGRGEVSENNKKLTVEMKSVNHRYLDVNIKLPKTLNFFEAYVRNLLKNVASRGKVDIAVSYEDYSGGREVLIYNEALAKEYYQSVRQMGLDLKIENDVTTSSFMNCPGIFEMQEQAVNEEELEQMLKVAFDEAGTRFLHTREEEGMHLKEDLLQKLEVLSGYADFLEERSPQIVLEFRERLEQKVKELLDHATVDDSRIAMEVTIFADKICIDEEIVRLKSHIDVMKNSLQQGGEVGRKLDFVAQEMNREANTILSKSTDIEINNVGIELKTLIEKIREQIQNIE